MTMQATNAVDDAAQGFILPPNKIELESVKVQMVLGSLLIVAVCFLNYLPTLHVGLLLDDFNHVEYVYRAVAKGDWADFLSNFYSNWAHLDMMRSYRPMISASFLPDYLFYGLKFSGYHVTNILLFAISALFVSLTALELTGLYGNRSRASVAIWAGLLFAAYPLHVESVTWIIGRVDLVCSALYFPSVYCFLRYRLVRERQFLITSMLLFFLALASKEMAVTLPVVQTLVCLLPIKSKPNTGTSLVQKVMRSDIKFALLFWIELGIFFLMRTAFIGASIGGYGSSDLQTILNSWRVFADKATLGKIFIPMNEELVFPNHVFDTGIRRIPFGLPQICGIAFSIILLTAIARLTSSKKLLPPLLFVLAWAAVALLPTFQIWHIYPNLVGSRLFFTSSGPFCIAIALCAIPGTDALGRLASRLWTYVGTAALTTIFVAWSYILQTNIQPWNAAAIHMQTFRKQATAAAQQLEANQKCLLLNVPPDYKGAGLVMRAWYVQQIMRPPFSDKDYSNRFICVEPIVAGSHDFVWPTELKSLLQDKTVAKKLIWNYADGKFVPFEKIPGNSITQGTKIKNFLGATIEPASAWSGLANEWRVQSDRLPGMEIHPDFRRLIPAKQPENRKKHTPLTMSFWLPGNNVNPLDYQYARINMKFNGSDSDLGGCRLIWKSQGLNLPGQNEHEAIIQKSPQGEYYAWLGRYRSWCFNDAPRSIGLKLPGGSYSVDLKDIELLPDAPLKPTISIDRAPHPYTTPGTLVRPQASSDKIHWQVDLPAVSLAVLRISRPDLTFDPNSELDVMLGPPGYLDRELKCDATKGSMSITSLNLKPGTTQIQVVGLDHNGHIVGLPSEPVSIKIDEK